MTKKHFCEFCDVRIQNNMQIRKKHNEGLIHQQERAEHYKKFKSAEEIIAEERPKKFCNRFVTARCSFGAYCHFSHYTDEQLTAMEDEGK